MKSLAEQQAEIDRIQWYHDFDFGQGLRARSQIDNVDRVRLLWQFIERRLDKTDFAGKSVLDVGTWDGYWSFYAERRGARSVLATDDASQNWSTGQGLKLAKELLRSRVELRQDLSIYQIADLKQTFDIILCLGVFYHLRDPFFGFAQLRHCCHSDSVLLCEGELAWNGVKQNEVRYLYNAWLEFLPSPSALKVLLESAYFRIESQEWLHPFPTPPSANAALQSDRAFMVCRPFEGRNETYLYKPHFGLHVYDDRFREGS